MKTLKITAEQSKALAEAMREMGLFLASKHSGLVSIKHNQNNNPLCLEIEFSSNFLSPKFLKELFGLFVLNKINTSVVSLPSLDDINSSLRLDTFMSDDEILGNIIDILRIEFELKKVED